MDLSSGTDGYDIAFKTANIEIGELIDQLNWQAELAGKDAVDKAGQRDNAALLDSSVGVKPAA